MMKNFLAVLFLFFAASSYALEIITLDGKAFHDCEVKKVEREGVRIVHRDGTAFLDFDQLPFALQKQYGWTPEKAAARKAEKDAIAEKQQVANENARKAQAERAAAIAKGKEMERAEQIRQAEAKAAEREAQIREKESEKNRAAFFEWGMIALGLLIGLPIYFLPSIIGRKKANAGAIFAMNLFLGWVFIGWVIALIWACTKDAEPHRVVVQNVIVNQLPNVQPRPVAIPRVVAKAIPPPRNPTLPPGA